MRLDLKAPSESFDLDPAEGNTNAAFEVVGVGVNAVDHLCVVPRYPRFDTKSEIVQYEILPGGPTATAAIFLARMGVSVRYVGKVGSDPFGSLSLESLRAERIDITSVRTEPEARNQFAVILVDRSSGERTVLWQRDPRLNLREGELDRATACSGRLLLLDGVDAGAALRAASWARKERIPVLIDLDHVVPGVEELISKVDFLIVSAGFPSELTGIGAVRPALVALNERCPGFVAATRGAEGALAVLDGQCVAFPAPAVRAIDTTGAGDIFHGAFAYGLLQNWTLDRIMRFANAAAAASCTRLGARAGIRSLEQIEEFAGSGRLPPA